MPNPPIDDELRAELSRAMLKNWLQSLPSRIDAGRTDLKVNPVVLDAIMSLIHQDRAALLERVDVEVIGASPDAISVEEEPDAWARGVKGLRNSQHTALATIKKEVGEQS